jgi:hypothetical protein
MPFQPSLMLASNAGAYMTEVPYQVLQSRVGHSPQTLD